MAPLARQASTRQCKHLHQAECRSFNSRLVEEVALEVLDIVVLSDEARGKTVTSILSV
jgi:hypothetical protein